MSSGFSSLKISGYDDGDEAIRTARVTVPNKRRPATAGYLAHVHFATDDIEFFASSPAATPHLHDVAEDSMATRAPVFGTLIL